MQPERLKWDSDNFGYPVGRLILNSEKEFEAGTLREHLKRSGFRVIYIFTQHNNEELNHKVVRLGAELVDKKTTFQKATEYHSGFSNQFEEASIDQLNQEMIDLVLQAGAYSRFKNDRNFRNREYEKLYLEWITKSLNREIAFSNQIVVKDTRITGLLTLGQKGNYADIGLVAVDSKFRGLGIAYDLVRQGDTLAFDKGFREIKVVTQYDNSNACNLYRKCGFSIESIVNVYHFWNQ